MNPFNKFVAESAYAAALARISEVRPEAYARTRNHLDGAVTCLSPYITHGVVTLREVLTHVVARAPLEIGHKLVYELGWREFFRHAWAHQGQGIESSLHEGPLPEDAYTQALPEDIRQARTGVPAIDEAVRTLYATGMLHNHARMWLASYVVHFRRVHWRAGADWMVAHLFDGDLGSNHLSWQWVAGTGSSKPYLFNAENVARFAPKHWHSPGSVIDRSYEALDLIARGQRQAFAAPHRVAGDDANEPVLSSAPPIDLGLNAIEDIASLIQGREVWLVHPWALRTPPADVPSSAVVLGVYLADHHARWPWSEQRWRWVHAAMREVASHCVYADQESLQQLLSGAAHVRSVADPHITPWLKHVAKLDEAPVLFPHVERPCTSFSQWWTRATRGLKQAQELL